MKNLTRVFMAVAALFTVACTTDVTEDLGVQLGEGKGQTITLSLEESRTQLGEKAGDLYPLYWSEGDKIAINGVASVAAQIDSENNAMADFVFTETVERPYNIVYPAPAEGVAPVTAGLQVVTFPATQNYTAGTFESGTAPMYGYAAAPAEGEVAAPIQINHLTGVLRLAVKGEKTLTSMTVVAETGAIAGNFDVNCESGALTAHEDASNTITLSFGEGLALSDTATPIYVAVPAGEHGIYTITLFTNEAENNAMVVRFNSDNHPVSVGVVKEFGEVTFLANATAEPVSGELVIENEADLVRLAKMSEVGLLGSVTSVRVAATLDMSNVEGWHGIDRFPAIPFDGGSDKGYEIKGLTAPLFQTSSAQIKNVKLTDVNIYSKDRFILGAIACRLVSEGTGEPASLTNCEVSGAITMDNEIALNKKYDSAYGVVMLGGMVGVAKGVAVSGCKNYASVTIKDISSSDDHTALCPAEAGIIGHAYPGLAADGTTVIYTCIDNCENRGAVKYEDCSEFKHRPFVAGILGLSTSSNGAGSSYTNLKNYGAISFDGVAYGQGGQSGSTGIAGVCGGVWSSKIEDCENRGTVTSGGTSRHVGIGGVVGYSNGAHHKNLHNYGAIEVTKEAKIIGVMAGGVGGCMYGTSESGSTDGCSNNATIKILGSTMENPNTGNYYYRVGGITGFGRHPFSNCVNNADGDILIEGNIVNVGSGSERLTQISGAIAYKTNGPITNCDNYGDVTVNGNFTILTTDEDAIKVQPLSIAGITSTGVSPSGSENHGNITFGGSFSGYRFFIGGILANGVDSNVGPASNSTNYGNISISKGAVVFSEFFMGGCAAATERAGVDKVVNNGKIFVDGTIGGTGKAGRIGGVFGYATTAHTNLVNNGEIELGENSTFGGATHVAGVVGRVYGKTVIFDGYTNNGNITKKGKCTNTMVFGGVLGSAVSSEVKNMTNKGEIKIGGIHNGRLYVGGSVAYHNDDGYTLLTNIYNYKPITITGEYNTTNELIVGGVCSYIQGKNGHSNIYNYEDGDITLNLTKCAAVVYVGGITGKFQDSCSLIENHGTINILGNYNSSIYSSGLIAQANGYARKNCLSAGDVTVDAKIGGIFSFGGICSGGNWGGTLTSCKNTANVTVSANTVIEKGSYIGGMFGYFADGNSNIGIDKCSNSGNFTFAGEMAASAEAPAESDYNKVYTLTIGGLVGQIRDGSGDTSIFTSSQFVNSGKIEFSGKSTNGSVYIGGIVGDMHLATDHKTKPWVGEIVNTGDIICTGTFKVEGYAAGSFGRTITPVPNATTYCTLNAAGFKTGMVTGSDRSATVTAPNCKVGGFIASFDSEDAEYKSVALTELDFYNYIFGSGDTTDWTDSTNYDGASFLSEAPSITPAE